MSDPAEGDRSYPRTWLLVDVADREPRLIGREVVDLSPGAIELRRAASRMRGYAEERERWLRTDERAREARLAEAYRRKLSFGPDLAYWVEHDESRNIHAGRPFRNLSLRFSSRVLTPATSAEIGLYFYGRRPAVFGVLSADRVQGFIGYDWEPLADEDVRWLLRREMGAEG